MTGRGDQPDRAAAPAATGEDAGERRRPAPARPRARAAAVTRRRLLVGTGVAGAAAAGGVLVGAGASAPRRPVPVAAPPVALPEPVPGLPEAQHAWDATLAADRHGNRTAPRHQRVLLFELGPDPGVGSAQRLEAALRTIETRWPHGPGGVLTAVGWGPAWFRRLGTDSPVPAAAPMSDTEAPELEDLPAAVHLASDDPRRLDAADALLVGSGALRLVARRSGFTGKGLARRAARRLELPPGVEPPADSPLLMGFTSGLRTTQARERDITVADGPWAGSTTMHVSQLALTLTSWYRSLDDGQRIAQMFGPGVTRAEVDGAGTGVVPPAAGVRDSARAHGIVGHAQAASKARRGGRPVILRRDFNGTDGGQPVTHFVSYQRSIEDFAATRRAMNADAAVGVNGVDVVVNNGINEWISVHRRANFLVPPRGRRSFPGLPGWDAT